MYALEIAINDQRMVVGGSRDLGVLTAGIFLTGKLGPDAAPHHDDGSINATLRLGGLTARADGVTDEHLNWLRSELNAGDVVTIRIVETEHADAVIGSEKAQEMADEERSYFEHCKGVYLELRDKFEPAA